MSRRTDEEVLEDFENRARSILRANGGEVTDGRVAIGVRNHEKIIEALIELVTEGKAGTIDEIVERSGVARRSIFRHFTDQSDLLLAAMRSVLAKTTPVSILVDPGVGPLDRRIESFVEARLRTLAVWHPFRSGANARLVELDAVKSGLRVTTELLRDQISRHFANELGTVAAADVENVIDAIFIVASYESYDISIRQLGRSVDTVRASWQRSMRHLLAP